jgi:hypothetical protein
METLQRTANRGSISTGYDIDNSVKLEPDNTEMLYTGSLTAGNRRTWTISMWVKRTELSYESAFMYSQGTYGNIRFFTDDKIVIENHNLYLITNRVFRDTSAWYHVVWVNDSTQSTASNRSKLYINGVQETSFSTETYMSQNEEGNVNSTSGTYIGRRSNEVKHFAGYIADVYKVDGQALAPTDFGEFDEDSGIWKPKAYTGGSYSTQGFHLDFSDSSDLGNDSSGENNDFLLQNITAADQATDTPTNNFCIMSPLWNYANDCVISDGGSYIDGSAAAWNGAKATFGLTAGKWYWEIKQLGSGGTFMGLQTDGEDNISSGNAQSQNTSVVFYTDGTLQYSGGSESTTSASNSITTNSIVGFALDLDSGTQTIKIYLDGSLITTFGSSGTCNLSTYNIEDTTVFPFVAIYENTVNMNFGGYTRSSISSAAADANGYGTFEYAPPSGYYALCTKNLAEYG